MVRISQAAREDSLVCDVAADASHMREQDAEKAAHELFRKHGLSLDVPISWVRIQLPSEQVDVPFLKPSDFLVRLVQEDHSNLLWAGGKCEDRCRAFWRAYFHFQPTHEVYKHVSSDELETVVPVMLHGDEGSGSKKQPISIVSWQTPWGHPHPARKRAKRKHLNQCSQCGASSWSPCCSMPTSPMPSDDMRQKLKLEIEDINELETQWPSVSGHSYLSRHLIFALPTYMVNKGPQVLREMLAATSDDMAKLFYDGITIRGAVFHVALIALKGDAKWRVATGNFFRSYLHLGSVNDHEVCPHDLAGNAAHPFEDCTNDATWVSTLHQSIPWTEPGPFERIPFDCTRPSAKYSGDPLHIFKIGLGRDLVGSVLVLLARFYGAWDWPNDKTGLWSRMSRAHSRFRLWCQAEGEVPHFKLFSKDFLHMNLVTDYPYTGSKGADTMLLIRWLCVEIKLLLRQEPPVTKRQDLLQVALQVCEASRMFFRTLYSHGLWLGRDCMVTVRDNVLVVTRGYSYMACICIEEKFPAFALKTTLHMFHHYAVSIDHCLQRGSFCYPNILLTDCCTCEDFIGRTARVSRSTHARTSSLRCIQRHLLKVKAVIRKSKTDRPGLIRRATAFGRRRA